jgi:hypothetical protein
VRDSTNDQVLHDEHSTGHHALETAWSTARASYAALGRAFVETEVYFELDAAFPGDAMPILQDACREAGWMRSGYEMYRAPQWFHDLCNHYLVYGHPAGDTSGRSYEYPSIGAVVPVPNDPVLQELMRTDGLSSYSLPQLSEIVKAYR